MSKLFYAVPAVLALAVATPVVAPASTEPENCIEGCNRDFPGETPEQVAIRGWCYILRGCWL
jgi:hypothetical protein